MKNDIPELVKNFDIKYEPLLNFDDELKECLDNRIKKETAWNKIAVACRRMIICDRELDLGRGKELIKETRDLFQKLINSPVEKQFEAFEAIRYANTCGLILYRSGNYLDALNNFSEARKLAIKYELKYFIPDTESNVLRADFEFFAHPLPTKFTDDHIIKLEQKCLEYIEKYDCEIKRSHTVKPEPDNEDERLNLIYGHGMASLHHNLGEAYSKALSIRKKFDGDKVGYSQLRTKDINKLDDFINELCKKDSLSSYLIENLSGDTKQKFSTYKPDKISKEDAELLTKALIGDLNKILKEKHLFKEVYLPMERLSEIAQKLITENPQGEELIRLNRLLLEDYYDQIDKRELNRLDLLEKSKEQHELSLKCGNETGDVYRQLQSKNALSKLYNEIKDKYETDVLNGNWQRGKQFIYQSRIRNSNTIDDVNVWIRKDDFRLDVTDGDKFVLLYNLDSIKHFLLKPNSAESVKIKDDQELDILKIAELKIKISEDIRNIYSPILYKREVVKLIRNDIALVVDNFLKHEKYPEALNFIEKYNNRSINDLINSEIKDGSRKQKDEIVKWKMEILKILDSGEQNRTEKSCEDILSTKMSAILGDDIDKCYLKLIFAYEDILKKPGNNSNKNEIDNEDLCGGLIDRLKKIHSKDNTAIIKFLIHEDPLNKQKPSKIYAFCIDRNGIEVIEIKIELSNLIKDIKKILEQFEKDVQYFDNEDLYGQMAVFGKEFDLYFQTNSIKNLFIIPDGELFQVPLHLMSKDGRDLRKDINVYYSPSLTQLLIPNIKKSHDTNEKPSYLWFRSPTKNLSDKNNKPCLKKPDVKDQDIITLECMNATLDSFDENYKKNECTHIGFSTHCAFHDNLVTAYVSFIRFYNSFLTTYDILMLKPDHFSNVKTIFLGACSGGSSKFTDENEAVGLVTAFLAKKAYSVIAPICNITVERHNLFIDVINESETLKSSNIWNLSSILKNLNPDDISSNHLIPFVQYANLELVEKYGNK